MTIKYKYNEGDLLRQVTDYVNATYGQHYSQNKYQATEFIIDGGHGVGFTVGNIMKYAQRYGHKGTPEDWRKDLMKVIHYAIIALYVHDKAQEPSLAELFTNVNIDPAKFSIAPSGVKIRDLPSTFIGDTISVTLPTATPDWSTHNMGTSSLLTTDNISSITVTGNKTKKKKG
jgi:hypothetical protein